MTQEIVNPDRHSRYSQLTLILQTQYERASMSIGAYWLALRMIDQEGLWDTAFDTREDWLADLSVQPYGVSRSSFFDTTSIMDMLEQHGATPEEVAQIIGHNRQAIIYDFRRRLLIRDTDGYALKEGVAAELERRGLSLVGFVHELSRLSPGQARKHVSDMTDERRVWITDASWNGNHLSVRLIESGGQDGDRYYDVTISSHQTLPPLARTWLENKFRVFPVRGSSS